MKISDIATVNNPLGLHARPSVRIVDVASKFNANIKLKCENFEADAKVILEIMSIGAACGTQIIITADGDDAETAVKTIKELLESHFQY